jgi:hypothetical protein
MLMVTLQLSEKWGLKLNIPRHEKFSRNLRFLQTFLKSIHINLQSSLPCSEMTILKRLPRLVLWICQKKRIRTWKQQTPYKWTQKENFSCRGMFSFNPHFSDNCNVTEARQLFVYFLWGTPWGHAAAGCIIFISSEYAV